MGYDKCWIAVVNGVKYGYEDIGETLILRTKDKNKLDDAFHKDSKGYYIRQFRREEISDIYRCEIKGRFVTSPLIGTDTFDLMTVREDYVALYFRHSSPCIQVPDWEVFCTDHGGSELVRRLNYSDLSGAVIEYTYYKKNGVEYNDPPLYLEEVINPADIYRISTEFEMI